MPQYAPYLCNLGYTSEYFLLHCQPQDLESIGCIPDGHMRVIMHVVTHVKTTHRREQAMPTTTVVKEWLAGIHPQLAAYSSTLALYGYRTTLDLCRANDADFIRMDIKLAHRRLLNAFIERIKPYYTAL